MDNLNYEDGSFKVEESEGIVVNVAGVGAGNIFNNFNFFNILAIFLKDFNQFFLSTHFSDCFDFSAGFKLGHIQIIIYLSISYYCI